MKSCVKKTIMLSKSAKTTDRSHRVFGKAGAQAFMELISQIETGIIITEEKPDRHCFSVPVMEFGSQFKLGVRVRDLSEAEYDTQFACAQESYNREEQETKDAYLWKLSTAAAWVHLAGNERASDLIKEETKKVDTITPYEQPLLLALSLKTVLKNDAARPADLVTVKLDADSRDYIYKGLLQLTARINMEARSIEESIQLNGCPPTFTLESLRKLVEEIDCKPIAELLADVDTNTIRTTQFIIPRCFDLLGFDPTTKSTNTEKPAPSPSPEPVDRSPIENAGKISETGYEQVAERAAAKTLAGVALGLRASRLNPKRKATDTILEVFDSERNNHATDHETFLKLARLEIVKARKEGKGNWMRAKEAKCFYKQAVGGESINEIDIIRRATALERLHRRAKNHTEPPADKK
jgi:hypothetical protein